jgi:flagellar biosynthesis protein FlhB
MAENGTEKTEQPTGRKLGKARDEGHVPQSVEMVSSVSLVALIAAVYLLGSQMASWAATGIRSALSCDPTVIGNSQMFLAYLQDKLVEAGMVMAPYLLVLMVPESPSPFRSAAGM